MTVSTVRRVGGAVYMYCNFYIYASHQLLKTTQPPAIKAPITFDERWLYNVRHLAGVRLLYENPLTKITKIYSFDKSSNIIYITDYRAEMPV